MAVENIIVFFVYIQSTLGIFNPQLLYYNPTYSSPGSQFQVGSKFIIHLKCLSLLFSSSFRKTFCKNSNFKFSLVLESVCRCVWVYAGVHGCVGVGGAAACVVLHWGVYKCEWLCWSKCILCLVSKFLVTFNNNI